MNIMYRDRDGLVHYSSMTVVRPGHSIEWGDLTATGDQTVLQGWGKHSGPMIEIEPEYGAGMILLLTAEQWAAVQS